MSIDNAELKKIREAMEESNRIAREELERKAKLDTLLDAWFERVGKILDDLAPSTPLTEAMVTPVKFRQE